MQQVALKANYRKTTRRGEVKKLRTAGVVPGVVYGAHTKPVSVEVAGKDLEKALHSSTSENVLVELDLAGGSAADKRLAMVQEVQHDHLSGKVLHVDFHELKSDEKFTANVPVNGVGEPSGVKNNGGVLEYALRYLQVRCLPKDLPERINVDVTKLEIGQSIHVGDLVLPAGVESLQRKDLPVFIVVAPQVEEEVAPAAGEGAPTEPEVITAKKAEGEEGEGEDAKGEKPKADAAKGDAKAAKPDAKAAKPEAKKK